MEHETFYLDTGNDRVYFNVIDGTIVCHGKTSSVPYDKFITFIQTARELGLTAGKKKNIGKTMTESQSLLLYLLDKTGYDITKAREAYDFVTAQDGITCNAVSVSHPEPHSDGVYLHYADHHEEKFNGYNDKPNIIGITVRLGGHSATLALYDVKGYQKLLPSNLVTRGRETLFYEALSEWDGAVLTANLYKHGCNIPLDRTLEYIPSLREMLLFVENLPKVREALAYAGGDDFVSNSSYWTSSDTVYGVWVVDFPTGYIPGSARADSDGIRVRPCLFFPAEINIELTSTTA